MKYYDLKMSTITSNSNSNSNSNSTGINYVKKLNFVIILDF